jgi:hypothetical protein
MSNSRQHGTEPAVRGYAVTHPPGVAEVHIQPGWDQLLYTASGVLTAYVDGHGWTVPADRALWIPAGQRAVVRNRRPVAVRALFLPSGPDPRPPGVRAVAVPHFGRELLLHMVARCPLYADRPAHLALRTLLTDELERWTSASLGLPVPRDPRGRAFVDAVRDAPARSDPARAGASTRTLERIFRRETGLSLGAWRRRANIMASLDTLLATGSVTDAAMAAGYGTPSAYITAFRRELDTTPGSFLRSATP